VRVGRYGTYVEDADGNRANVDEDLAPDELTVEKARELLATPAGRRSANSAPIPATGNAIVAKNGRYGPYVTEVLPEDAPKSAPQAAHGVAVQGHELDTVTLEQALQLLSLPRVVGPTPTAWRSPRRTAATART
jgi:DNA topoisomerase-1